MLCDRGGSAERERGHAESKKLCRTSSSPSPPSPQARPSPTRAKVAAHFHCFSGKRQKPSWQTARGADLLSASCVLSIQRSYFFFFFLRNCCFAALFLFFFISFPSKHQFCLGEGSEGAKATGLELRPCQEEWQSPGGPAMPSLRATSSPRPSPQLV